MSSPAKKKARIWTLVGTPEVKSPVVEKLFYYLTWYEYLEGMFIGKLGMGLSKKLNKGFGISHFDEVSQS